MFKPKNNDPIMSQRFKPLAVKEVVHETSEAFSIYFQDPGTDEFKYQPGQYLILQAEVEGKPLRRAFSLSTSPYLDDDLAVTIKCIEEGQVSNYLHQNLKAGDTLQVMPPQGKFTVNPDPNRQHHYILMGGGSGITPLISILRSVLYKEPESYVSLFYANRDEESTIFKKALEELEQKYGDRFQIIHSLDNPPAGWTGYSGKPNEESLKEILQSFHDRTNLQTDYYLCGPPPMMELAKSVLGTFGVQKEAIHQENFTASLPETQVESEKARVEEEEEEESGNERPEKATVTIILDDEEHVIEVTPNETILEAAIDEGVDPPFACQEGICTTCQARLHQGRVHMDEDEGLTDDEMEEGYILTCQSHPLTKEVKVEYE